jgi:phospholipid/cholesterol/gamma-HCH transport system ATP-binding protein
VVVLEALAALEVICHRSVAGDSEKKRMIDLPKLRIRGLAKDFGAGPVLAGVDLDLAAGDNLVILGASGSGKTVLFKCILGLIKPDAGSIAIAGQETVDLDESARFRLFSKVGVLFQNGALFDSMPVWQNVAFASIATGHLKPREARKMAIEKLGYVGLNAAAADLLPAELSGGMKKRAALARAFATDPEILLLDSPTDGLDPIMAAIVDEFILKLTRRNHATTMTITHDIARARRIADRVAMLHNGRIIWEGPIDQLDRSGNTYVQEFVRRGSLMWPPPAMAGGKEWIENTGEYAVGEEESERSMHVPPR